MRSDEVQALWTRLQAAKRRLRYWSGVPSLMPGSSYRPIGGRQMNRDSRYETAWCDCISLADAIGSITGCCPLVVDVEYDFRTRIYPAYAAAGIGTDTITPTLPLGE